GEQYSGNGRTSAPLLYCPPVDVRLRSPSKNDPDRFGPVPVTSNLNGITFCPTVMLASHTPTGVFSAGVPHEANATPINAGKIHRPTVRSACMVEVLRLAELVVNCRGSVAWRATTARSRC